MSRYWLRHAGLCLAPTTWAAATQAGQITPYLDCHHGVSWSAVACATMLFLSIAGIAGSRLQTVKSARTERFILDGCYLLSSVLVFALSLQGAAAMLLDPCQR